MSSCYACLHPGKYDLTAIRWLKSEGKLCEDHLKKADELIAATKTQEKKSR